jgi:hypothetical protein
VSEETQQRILRSDPFADWWKGDNPLTRVANVSGLEGY